MGLRTVVGMVKLRVSHGKDPADGHWGCPIRERWGLKPHQEMSPALEEKLGFTATTTLSYQAASETAAKWGCAVDESVIHALVQRLGAKAETQTQERLQQPAQAKEAKRGAAELGVLMLDGWFARFRGEGWGKKKTKKDRVEYHEVKTGVFYREDQVGRTEGGRAIIAEKKVVRWQGKPMEFGQRLDWEAQRSGLARAEQWLAVGDGAAWIWNLVEDRWKRAHQLLDFWHGSEHLWELGRAYCGPEEVRHKLWVEARLHKIRHGKEKVVLDELAALKVPRGGRGKMVRKERNYFAGQQGRMNYAEVAGRGWPIGSGAVESQCNRSQGRFKRSGQFWIQSGLRHLSALDEAKHNGHWDEIWATN
jgi:hypothetical protein